MDKIAEVPRAEIFSSREMIDFAKDIANQHGSTVQSFGILRSELLHRISNEPERESTSADPSFTRLNVQLLNEGLKAAGIEDEMILLYHFTSEEGMRNIEKDRAIKAVGKSAFVQVKEAFDQGGFREAFRAFWYADNLERVAVHVTETIPEKVRTPGDSTLMILLNSWPRLFRLRKGSVGIPKQKLRYYYEVISAKSDQLFKESWQQRTHLIDISELYFMEGSLSLDEKNQYMVLGPRANTYLK